MHRELTRPAKVGRRPEPALTQVVCFRAVLLTTLGQQRIKVEILTEH